MSHAGTETEIKLRVASAAAGKELLLLAGFQILHERVFEANIVFDTTEQELRSRGELLRLRQAGSLYTLTYKGLATTGRHKSREELETTVLDFENTQKILNRLGFAQIFRYEKYRTEFHKPGEPGIATLDETPIGTFLELEGTSDWIDDTAPRIGFAPGDYITESYGALFLRYRHERNLELRDMTWDN